MSINVNDFTSFHGRKRLNLVVCHYDGKQLVFKFNGETVPGALTVLKQQYINNGKWSYTTWKVEPCKGVTILTISQDLKTGKWLNSLEWKSAITEFNDKIRTTRDTYENIEPIDKIAVERFIRFEWSDLAKVLDMEEIERNKKEAEVFKERVEKAKNAMAKGVSLADL